MAQSNIGEDVREKWPQFTRIVRREGKSTKKKKKNKNSYPIFNFQAATECRRQLLFAEVVM